MNRKAKGASRAVVRIIAGRLRGRRLAYRGDPRTRPMKDRVREAVFNLIREEVQGRQVIDLFAGTGALGLEAISRGAAQAVLIEKHLPTAATIRRNVDALGVGEQARVVAADAFAWAARPTVLGSQPWLVFCSPPYELYVSNKDAMLRMLGDLLQRAPQGSTLVVEADKRFDFRLLPDADDWDIRHYPPATIAIYRKPAG